MDKVPDELTLLCNTVLVQLPQILKFARLSRDAAVEENAERLAMKRKLDDYENDPLWDAGSQTYS